MKPKQMMPALLGIGLLAIISSVSAADKTTTMARYGVCGSIEDNCYHAWFDRTSGDEAPWKVLIYSYVGKGVKPHENREDGVAALKALFESNGIEVTTSQDPADMESGFKLRPYDAIVFFNTGRDALNSLGEMALRLYVEGGGGFVGIHNAFGTNFNWRWYEGLLGGQLFDHAPAQKARVVAQSKTDPSVDKIPQGKEFAGEEFYNIYPNPVDLTDIKILLTVDEKTMKKGTRGYFGNPGMGNPHPVSWCHYYDGGRAWLTTLGHSEEILSDKDYLNHVLAGVNGVMGRGPFCQP